MDSGLALIIMAAGVFVAVRLLTNVIGAEYASALEARRATNTARLKAEKIIRQRLDDMRQAREEQESA